MELILAFITAVCSLFTPAESISEVDVPIIMYHHIEPDESKLNEFMVTPKKIEEDLAKIRELGYKTISYGELYNFVDNNGSIPNKPIIITFDDGYESNYKYAYPVLKKYDMKATIAAIGVMVGQDTYKGADAFRHFTYEEANEMVKSGLIDVQTHTFDLHNLSSRIGVKRNENEDEETYINTIKTDIIKATDELKENVGNRQFVFTYPYGAYDSLTEKIMEELGFEITVTTDSGINHVVRNDKKSLLKLKRYNITNETDIEEILK